MQGSYYELYSPSTFCTERVTARTQVSTPGYLGGKWDVGRVGDTCLMNQCEASCHTELLAVPSSAPLRPCAHSGPQAGRGFLIPWLWTPREVSGPQEVLCGWFNEL